MLDSWVWLDATEGGLVAAYLLACFICNRILPRASFRFLSEVAQLSPKMDGPACPEGSEVAIEPVGFPFP